MGCSRALFATWRIHSMLKNKKCQALLIAASAFIGINGNVYGSNLGKPYPTRIDGDGRVMKDPLAMVNRQAAYRGEVDRQMNLTDHLKKAQESPKAEPPALPKNFVGDDYFQFETENLLAATMNIVLSLIKDDTATAKKNLQIICNITSPIVIHREGRYTDAASANREFYDKMRLYTTACFRKGKEIGGDLSTICYIFRNSLNKNDLIQTMLMPFISKHVFIKESLPSQATKVFNYLKTQ